MRAIQYHRYGSPDQLHLCDSPKPTAKKGEVLLKVMATSLNSWDADMLKGDTWIIRVMNGFFKPRTTILGADVAGVVVEVGESVRGFSVGDEVYGDIAAAGFGALAEFVAVPEKLLAKKPVSLSFAQAASLPQAGLLAVQGLQYHGDVEPGKKVLINGAGGGVGTLALQYSKSAGAEVTCVDREEKFEVLRSLGADHLIDFAVADYTATSHTYDKILDVIAHRSTSDYKRALTPTGVFAMVGGSMKGLLFRMMVIEPMLSRFRNKKLGIMGYRAERKELEALTDLITSGRVKPVIDHIFSLEDAPEAFRYFFSGKFKGKIVVEVSQES